MLATSPPAFDVVVLGGSAGGLHAVGAILEAVPATFPAAIVVALHRPVEAAPALLPRVLDDRTPLEVHQLRDGALGPGQVGVLPAQTELHNQRGQLRIERSRGRLPIDATMAAVAELHGPRCLGVVLSGRLTDGTVGARLIKRAGGRVLAQDPAEASAPGMPTSVIASGSVDFVLPLRGIAAALVALTMAPGAADLLRTHRSAWAV